MSLKSFVKGNVIFSSTYYLYRKSKYAFAMKKHSRCPVEKKWVIFNNFNGNGFGDNPRAVAEKMHILAPHFRQFWVCRSRKAVESLPSYIEPVMFESKLYYKILSICGTWVFNVNVPDGVSKKREQLYIQTWHGERGFKKIANDAIKNSKYGAVKKKRRIIENEICDYFVTGSTFGESVYKTAFGYEGQYLRVGSPRNDCLFQNDLEKGAEIRRKLSLNTKDKIVLYAPTFRGTDENGNQIDTTIDLDRVVSTLNHQTDEVWLCMIRAHGGDKLVISQMPSGKIIDVTLYPDMADLLMIADLLITDYSSSAGDFILSGKPVILYQDDFESYTTNDRGLYFNIEDSHYWCAHNQSELEGLLTKENLDKSQDVDQRISEFYGTYETGNSSAKVCEIIIKHHA